MFDQIVQMSSYSEENAAKGLFVETIKLERLWFFLKNKIIIYIIIVIRSLTSAIQHLHYKKIVHRDLKVTCKAPIAQQ